MATTQRPATTTGSFALPLTAGLALISLFALGLPGVACERHLQGHQGAQSSTANQNPVQR